MKKLNKLIMQLIFLSVFINILNAYSEIVDPSVQKRLDKEEIEVDWIIRDTDGIEPSKITMKTVDDWMLETMSYGDESKFNKMIEEYNKRIEEGNYTNVSDIQDEWDGTKERERKAKERELAKYKEAMKLRKIKNRNYYVCTSPLGESYDIFLNGDKLKFKNKVLSDISMQIHENLLQSNRLEEIEIYYKSHSLFFSDDEGIDVVILGTLKGTLMYEAELYQCKAKVFKTKEELLAERVDKMRKDNKGKNNTYICGIEEQKPVLVTGTKYNLTLDSKIYQNMTDDGLDKVKSIKGYIEYAKHKFNSTIFYGDPKSLEKLMYIDKKTNKLYTLEKKEETSTFCERMF